MRWADFGGRSPDSDTQRLLDSFSLLGYLAPQRIPPGNRLMVRRKTHQEYATSFFRPYTTFELNSAFGNLIYRCNVTPGGVRQREVQDNRKIVRGHFNNDLRVLCALRKFHTFFAFARLLKLMVARDGIEPPTPAFSGPRSTN